MVHCLSTRNLALFSIAILISDSIVAKSGLSRVRLTATVFRLLKVPAATISSQEVSISPGHSQGIAQSTPVDGRDRLSELVDEAPGPVIIKSKKGESELCISESEPASRNGGIPGTGDASHTQGVVDKEEDPAGTLYMGEDVPGNIGSK